MSFLPVWGIVNIVRRLLIPIVPPRVVLDYPDHTFPGCDSLPVVVVSLLPWFLPSLCLPICSVQDLPPFRNMVVFLVYVLLLRLRLCRVISPFPSLFLPSLLGSRCVCT